VNRRTFLSLLSTPVLLALLDACSDDHGSDGDPSAEQGEARSPAARRATTPADAAPAADSLNRFGMDLYRLAASVTTGNLVLSPTSIASALTMAAAGAQGSTLDEMVATLRIDDPATIHHAMNALTAELERRSTDKVTLAMANSMWAQNGFQIETPFLDVLAAEYGAGLQLVDYADDPDGSRREINGWVDDRTAGRIPELLSEDIITKDTRLTLVNAVYVKAPWLQQFDADATTDGTFATSADNLVRLPMMSMTEFLPYATGDGWQAVELAYEGGELSMLVFLPEEGFLADFEQIFLPTDATQYLTPTRVHLTMPRFDIKTATSLRDLLDALGMKLAFTDDADFSGISTAVPLEISAVVHQANITVDEAGTEAAAATAVVMQPTAAPAPEEEPVEMLVDQPFVFVLRDRTTEAILFIGRVGEPAGA